MARTPDRDQFLSDFIREVDDCIRFVSTHLDATHVRNDLNRRCSALQQELAHALAGNLISTSQHDTVNAILTELIGRISDQLNSSTTRQAPEHFGSIRRTTGKRGPSKYDITPAQLEFLLACRFTQKRIASILSVSPKTVSRRMQEWNLSKEAYSNITDESLDETVNRLMSCNRRIGANAVATRLHNIGVKVQRERVRKSVRRVDPAGVACRSRMALKRRSYRVHSPNSLWHLDGNHKLVRWRIIVHGAIDGNSRLITYMKASTNNKSSTVLALFKEAIAEYGVPSRIRCDNGGENVSVCEYMVNYHGGGRGSAIQGRSVHNQRIERNWLDMWNGCINVFYDLFTSLEEERLLNPNSEEQLFALHYVYIPHINHALKKFVLQWNHHKMRTESSMSPIQLFVQRSLEVQSSSATAATEMWNRDTAQSADPPEDANSSQELNNRVTRVDVPSTTMLISEEQFDELRVNVSPDETFESSCLGVTSYMKTLHFLSNMLGYN